MKNLLLFIRGKLVSFETLACGCLMIAMTAVICYGMFERFVIQFGIGWTDELSRYLSIWAIFMGASLGIVKGAHVGVEVFVNLLPATLQEWARRLSMAICAVFTGALTYAAIIYFIRLSNSGQITPALQIPMSWAFLAIPVGSAFMCVHFAIEIFVGGKKEAQNG